MPAWSGGEDPEWESKSLQLGNGSIGTNVFGSIQAERITLNEKSLWRGGPGTYGGAEHYWDANKESASILPEIHLIPALPSAWPDGKVTGLLARGGFEVDREWSDGRLINAVIHSRVGSRGYLRYGQTTLEFDTKQGMAYHITF